MKSKNREKAAQAIEAFLRAIGESSETNVELRGTGARVADMFMDELCAGNQVIHVPCCEEHKLPDGDAKGWVIVRDRAISTTCPHHLMPAIGTISMGYLPKKIDCWSWGVGGGCRCLFEKAGPSRGHRREHLLCDQNDP